MPHSLKGTLQRGIKIQFKQEDNRGNKTTVASHSSFQGSTQKTITPTLHFHTLHRASTQKQKDVLFCCRCVCCRFKAGYSQIVICHVYNKVNMEKTLLLDFHNTFPPTISERESDIVLWALVKHAEGNLRFYMRLSVQHQNILGTF